MSSRGSPAKRHRHQNKHHSEDQLICINLTGLDGLVHENDSEASVYSESEGDDGERCEEEEDPYRRPRRGGERRSQQWSQDRNRPPPPPQKKYEPDSYYPQRGCEPSPHPPQHVHTHGHTHGSQQHTHGPHNHMPPMKQGQPPPENFQNCYQPPPPNCYQPAGNPQMGENANMSVGAPVYAGVSGAPQAQPPPSPHSQGSSNPIRHYSLNVTACTLGLEKLDAQIERKGSVIEIRFTGILKTNEEKYSEDIDSIARTLKTETEKCLTTCLPPGGNGPSPCFQTTMLMKSGAARELKRGGTIPAWLKQG